MALFRLSVCIFMSFFIFCGCFNKTENVPKTDIITENTGDLKNNSDYGKDMPVYRCLAARMISIISETAVLKAIRTFPMFLLPNGMHLI